MDCKILDENVRNIVTDSLIGLVTSNQEIILFDFGNVIAQKEYFGQDTVRIISGGVYCFGEFVGKGMLTGAVQGDNLMAPSSKIILRTIRELSLNHVKGILIIVPANSGDLLNFGLATERALNDNLRVKLLSVSDDINNMKLPKTCKRGLTGVLLVNKVAGAMSERNKSLTDIFIFCKKLLDNIVSIGINVKDIQNYGNNCACKKTVENKDPPNYKRIRMSFGTDRSICKYAVDEMSNICIDNDLMAIEKGKLQLKPEDNIVILLNNNGTMSKTEEMVCLKGFVNILSASAINVHRFYVGNFLKCSRGIDMTITMMKIFDSEVLYYLDDPCSAPGWKKVNQGLSGQLTIDDAISGKLKRKERLTPQIKGPKLNDDVANILLFSTQFACDAIISCEKQLNIIDSERGDGDTGTRMKNAVEVLLKRMKLNKLVTNYPFTFFESLSRVLEATVGGTVGCIYSILFEAVANCFGEFSENTLVTPFIWLKAFDHAARALKRYGNVDYGDDTMYDPIFGFIEAARVELENGSNFINAFGKGVAMAEKVAELTKRNTYRYPDSGAHAVGIWIRAAFEGVKLRCPID